MGTSARPAPRSAVSQAWSLLSLISFVSVSAVIVTYGIDDEITALVLLLLSIAIPSLIGETVYEKRQQKAGSISVSRSLTKIAGLYAIFIVIYALYALFPEYHSDRYARVMERAKDIMVALVIVSPLYIALTDARMADPRDGLYMTGRLVTLRRPADLEAARKYAMGWAVKLFFLPVMLAFALEDLHWFVELDMHAALAAPRGWFATTYRYLFLVDVVWASVGYLCTLRLFNSHIRSTEPTLMGWVVCLACDPPFWGLLYDSYLKYEDEYYWGDYFAVGSYGGLVWGALIIALVLIYVWATVSFGIRFSNLTNRGIITSGPYRFTKHPAYLAKNISWWMISVPFIAQSGVLDSMKMCCLLLLLNGIYYLRARTEEAHLSADAAYVEYAQWISQNGLLSRIRRAAGRLVQERSPGRRQD